MQAYTYNHTFYCVPKDSSTLALEINTDDVEHGRADQRQPPDHVGQARLRRQGADQGPRHRPCPWSNSLDRVGAFFAEAGGSYMNKSDTGFAFNSPQDVQALTYLQGLAKKGYLKFTPGDGVDAGWGGEAFGTGLAAMTVEGNWIIGAMQSDYPKSLTK